jgi:hypothetical protein
MVRRRRAGGVKRLRSHHLSNKSRGWRAPQEIGVRAKFRLGLNTLRLESRPEF